MVEPYDPDGPRRFEAELAVLAGAGIELRPDDERLSPATNAPPARG